MRSNTMYTNREIIFKICILKKEEKKNSTQTLSFDNNLVVFNYLVLDVKSFIARGIWAIPWAECESQWKLEDDEMP